MTSIASSPPSPKSQRRGGEGLFSEEPIVSENAQESAKVDAELNQHYVGTLTFFQPQLCLDWTESDDVEKVSNRPLDPRGVKQLVEAFGQNLDRINPKHHMAATSSHGNIHNLLKGINGIAWTKVDNEDFDSLRMQLKLLNDKAEYPTISSELWESTDCSQFICEAGQHRFAALEQVFPDKAEERYWPVRVYFRPLSLSALTRLRENVTNTQLPLSDGERFLQVMQIRRAIGEVRKQLVNAVGERAEEVLKMRLRELEDAETMKILEFSRSAATRAKPILARPTFAEAIAEGLSIPALARDFSFGSMGDVLALRCPEVILSVMMFWLTMFSFLNCCSGKWRLTGRVCLGKRHAIRCLWNW